MFTNVEIREFRTIFQRSFGVTSSSMTFNIMLIWNNTYEMTLIWTRLEWANRAANPIDNFSPDVTAFSFTWCNALTHVHSLQQLNDLSIWLIQQFLHAAFNKLVAVDWLNPIANVKYQILSANITIRAYFRQSIRSLIVSISMTW